MHAIGRNDVATKEGEKRVARLRRDVITSATDISKHLPAAITSQLPALFDHQTKLRVGNRATAATANPNVFKAEACLAIAAKFKYLDEHKPIITALKAHHKALVAAKLHDLLVSPTGGDLEDDEDLVEDFEKILAAYSFRKLAGCIKMPETDFAGLPTGDVRTVLECFHKLGSAAAAHSEAEVAKFQAESTVNIGRVREAWEDESSGTIVGDEQEEKEQEEEEEGEQGEQFEEEEEEEDEEEGEEEEDEEDDEEAS